MDDWSPPIREALERLVVAKRGAAPRPVAVLDLDNTCLLNDTGEAVLYHLVTTGALPRRTLWAYDDRLKRDGGAAAYPWLVQAMAGMRETALVAAARAAIGGELAMPIGTETIPAGDGIPAPLTIARGLRPFPAMARLMTLLKAHGFAVWIISASSRWAVAETIRACGWPVDGFVGISVVVKGLVLTDQLETPIPFGPGKIAVIRQRIGRSPALAIGDSLHDYPMLSLATDCAIVIDHRRGTAHDEATRRGWLRQPAWAVA